MSATRTVSSKTTRRTQGDAPTRSRAAKAAGAAPGSGSTKPTAPVRRDASIERQATEMLQRIRIRGEALTAEIDALRSRIG